jgi:hypothetical protein
MVSSPIHKSVALLLSPFAGEIPLEFRLEEARMRFERCRGAGPATAALECEILAVLMGRRAEAESFLLRSRSQAAPELDGLIESTSALVLREAGYPARVEGTLERDEAAPDTQEGPAARVLSLAIHAQVLLLTGVGPTAARAVMEALVEEGRFRMARFHRLQVVHLRLPPLRERWSNIPLLVEHHPRRHASRLHCRSHRVAAHVMATLDAYEWPSNVRKLAYLLEGTARLLQEDQDAIARTPPAIKRALQNRGARQTSVTSSEALLTDERVFSTAEVERCAFANTLRYCAVNVAKTAKALGVAKGTFYSKIQRYVLVVQQQETAPPVPREDLRPFRKLLS